MLAGTLRLSDPLILEGPGVGVFVGSCVVGHARPVLCPDGPPLGERLRGRVHTAVVPIAPPLPSTTGKGAGRSAKPKTRISSLGLAAPPTPGTTRPTPPEGGLLRAMSIGVCRHSAPLRPPYLRGTRRRCVCRMLHQRPCEPCARSRRPAPQGERLRDEHTRPRSPARLSGATEPESRPPGGIQPPRWDTPGGRRTP